MMQVIVVLLFFVALRVTLSCKVPISCGELVSFGSNKGRISYVSDDTFSIQPILGADFILDGYKVYRGKKLCGRVKKMYINGTLVCERC